MPNYCCVPLCNQPGGFKFPTEQKLREKWKVAIKRDHWTPQYFSVVCPAHFKSEDFYGPQTSDGIQRTIRRLKKTAVPSVFKWSKIKTQKAEQRSQRAKLRQENKNALENVTCEDNAEVTSYEEPFQLAEIEISTPEEIVKTEYICTENQSDQLELEELPSVTSSTNNVNFLNSASLIDLTNEESSSKKCFSEKKTLALSKFIRSTDSKSNKTSNSENLLNKDIYCLPYVCVERIQHSDRLVHHYTGLETFRNFLFAFYSLGPSAKSLNYVYTKSCSMEPIECFLLMLVKLRCNYPVDELARMFSLSPFSVSNIFYTWLRFCSCQWREINIWPSKEIVNLFMPIDFKNKFPCTRLIIDGTEFPIQKPSNPTAQRACFSSYKHKHTSKILVGATPGGLVSFVSDAYAGSTSDRQITERSDLTTKCEPKDIIMADKGFNVQDIFAAKDIQINIPSFFKQKNRLNPKTVERDRTISSKRVHIERIIGDAKKYKILCSPLNAKETLLSSDITFVCFMLHNFRSNIVSKMA